MSLLPGFKLFFFNYARGLLFEVSGGFLKSNQNCNLCPRSNKVVQMAHKGLLFFLQLIIVTKLTSVRHADFYVESICIEVAVENIDQNRCDILHLPNRVKIQ